MITLPQNVWELVAFQLPKQELLRMMSVNRAFLHAALDERYKSIEWATLDDKTIRILIRLQDSYIACRVRRLYIRAWFIQYLLNREKLLHEFPHDQSRHRLKQWKEFFGLTSRETTVSNSLHTSLNRPGEMASFKVIVDAITKAVNSMVNVTEYGFEWRDLAFNEDIRQLLTCVRDVFNSSLTKLVLRAQVSKFEHLLSPIQFRVLEELEIHFDFDVTPELHLENAVEDDGAKNETVLTDCVAPFINRLGLSLRCLTISSSAKGDHSQFLHLLGPFPKLQLLSIQISFEKDHLSYPSVLSHLLYVHSLTLLHVELRPQRISNAKYRSGISGTWPALSKQCLGNVAWLENLQSLTIPALHQKATVALLRHTGNNLTSLCLLDRYLDVHEIAEVIGAFSPRHRLKNLSMEVNTLTPELINLLANSFPELLSLTLVIENQDQVMFELTSFQSLEDAGYQRHTGWNLTDLSLFMKVCKVDSIKDRSATMMEDKMMVRLLESALPNVRSFKRRGHTRLEGYPHNNDLGSTSHASSPFDENLSRLPHSWMSKR